MHEISFSLYRISHNCIHSEISVTANHLLQLFAACALCCMLVSGIPNTVQYSNCISRSHNTIYKRGAVSCRTLELSNLALSKVAHGGGGGEGKLMCTKYQIRKFSQWKLANTHNMIDKDWSQVDLIITKYKSM